ncbi:MAG: nuclear transport factor 2 family protein [Myxococcota bacterium]
MARWTATGTHRPHVARRVARGRGRGRACTAGLAGVITAGALALLVAACGPRAFASADADAIEAVLNAQRDAWNRGDLDGFMAAYVQGPELVFTSGAAVRRGYDEALARYRARYLGEGGNEMGTLAFTDLEVTGVSHDAAVVLGRWALTETAKAGDGVFTLVFVRRAGAWKILHDHTSATPDPTPG